MTLRKLTNAAPRQEALIHIYKSGKAVFNAAAARLMHMNPMTHVDVRYDADTFTAREIKRLYVGVTSGAAYTLKQRGNTYSICSNTLCRMMADALEGYGTYRICPEDYVLDSAEVKFYNIFFKKYD